MNVYNLFETTIYKVILLTETWLKEEQKDEQFIPPRFAVHRHDRSKKNSEYERAGGVAVLIDRESKSIRLEKFENNDIEGLCVKVWLNNVPVVIYLAYIPEKLSDEYHVNLELRCALYEKHAQCIEHLLNNVNDNVLIIGDFNMREVKWESVDDGNHMIPSQIPANDKTGMSNFIEKMQYLSLKQYVHIPNDSGNIIDLVFMRCEMDIRIYHAPVTLTNSKQTDTSHPPLELELNIESNRRFVDDDFIEVLAYSRGNYEKMNCELNSINYAHEFYQRSVDEAFEFFYEKINTAIKNNIPTIRIKSNGNKPKWWNKELQNLKNRRNKEWKRRHLTGSNESYENAMKEFNELNEECFATYLNTIQEDIKYKPSSF